MPPVWRSRVAGLWPHEHRHPFGARYARTDPDGLLRHLPEDELDTQAA
jgi:hypothetical protein